MSPFNAQYMTSILRHEQGQAEALGEFLWALLRPASVLDLGCGPGSYLLPFWRHGASIRGVDSSPYAGGLLEPREFVCADLVGRGSFVAPRFMDLTLCIEVGQQFPQSEHVALVETVVASSPCVFWSSAGPGQEGIPHRTGNQSREYWQSLFGARGHYPIYEKELEAEFARPVYGHCRWLAANGILLKS